MSADRLKEYLRQIGESSQNAVNFLGGMQYAEFQEDIKTQSAVAMSLVIVGEAASRIEERFPEFIEAHPEIPWNAIRGMRNRIAHDYFLVNFEVIWSTVAVDLPLLMVQIAAIKSGQA